MRPRTDRPPYKPHDVVGGKYKLERVLAEGGFSVVYEATDTTVGRAVAIKVLRPGIARMRAYSREQLRRECEVLVKLHEVTPYVVEVLTAGITDDAHALPFYVMERLRGSTLRYMIVEKQRRSELFTIQEVLSFGITIAMALVPAHGLGIAHRDLKPENVFMSLSHGGDGILKLLDFGICIDVQAENEASEQGRLACSLPYAAPEQAEGRRSTTATDVYALGLLLFELLTLRLPHGRAAPGLTPGGLELALAEEPLPDLDTLRSDAPPRLLRLLARCLATTTESRPNAHEVAKELRDTKYLLEGKIGPKDASTDVDQPSIEELHRRLEAASPKSDSRRIVPSGTAVDLHATTEIPAARQSGGELFFAREAPNAPTGASTLIPETPPETAGDALLVTTLPDGPPVHVTAPLPGEPVAVAPIIALATASHGPPEERRSEERVGRAPERTVRLPGPPPTAAPILVTEPGSQAAAPSRGAAADSTTRSDPGPWLAATKAQPSRRRTRERVIVGLAFAGPILLALAAAPFVFGRKGTTSPPTLPLSATPTATATANPEPPAVSAFVVPPTAPAASAATSSVAPPAPVATPPKPPQIAAPTASAFIAVAHEWAPPSTVATPAPTAASALRRAASKAHAAPAVHPTEPPLGLQNVDIDR